ncbi:hypothetical protein IV76_GL002054 [Carnobacterium maltaromaticum]|nr:hypothetical protein IV76_GL002054 [Carnobacterium maltaromaticum]
MVGSTGGVTTPSPAVKLILFSDVCVLDTAACASAPPKAKEAKTTVAIMYELFFIFLYHPFLFF